MPDEWGKKLLNQRRYELAKRKRNQNRKSVDKFIRCPACTIWNDPSEPTGFRCWKCNANLLGVEIL